jgi:hypothetical protein
MRPKLWENRAMRAVAWMLAGALGGCTTLGPTPAMTGIPSPPLERPGVELQVAAAPGYYLSDTVTEAPKASLLPQLAAVFEPDELLHVPGLLAGARYAGQSEEGAALEPLLGYRTFLDEDKRFSLALLGFAAYASASDNGASFTALRGGLEVGVDARFTPRSKYAEAHANLGLTLTELDADGQYCLAAGSPYGIDCPSDASQRRLVTGSASGLFPSAHAGVSLDFGRHLHAPFHGVRLALDFAGGTLPTIRAGEQRSAQTYGSGGLSLTLGLGKNSGSGEH